MSHEPPKTSSKTSPKAQSTGFGRAFWFTIITFALVVGVAQWRVSVWLSQETSKLSDEVSAQTDIEQGAAQGMAQEEPDGPPLPPTVRLKRSLITLTFKEGEERFERTYQALHKEIEREFNAIRRESDQLVKGWADWYYSVTGEYTRLLKLLMSAAGEKTLKGAKQAASAYMSSQVKARLIDPIKADERVEALEDQVRAELQATNNTVIKMIKARLETLQKEAEKEGLVHIEDQTLLAERLGSLDELNKTNLINPFSLATKLVGLTGTKLLVTTGAKAGVKMSASTGGKVVAKGALSKAGVKVGVKAGQAVVTKVASKGLITSAVKLWGNLMIKLGIKSAAKGGGAAAAAVTGTASCAFLGLGAFACGAIAGTVTWFAVDKVVVEVDEHLNRAKFEANMRRDLNASWSEVEAELRAALDQHFARVQGVLRSNVSLAPLKQTTLMEVLDAPPEPKKP